MFQRRDTSQFYPDEKLAMNDLKLNKFSKSNKVDKHHHRRGNKKSLNTTVDMIYLTLKMYNARGFMTAGNTSVDYSSFQTMADSKDKSTSNIS